MARLMPAVGSGRMFGQARRDTDRAQMFLVIAVAMAALLVVLTIVLNAALFAGNLTASDDGVDEASVLGYRSGVVGGVAPLVTHANQYDNASYPDLQAAVGARVTTWSDLSGRQAAAGVSGASVGLDSTVSGTRVDQTDASHDFTDDGGTSSWELVPSTSNVRGFDLNVSRAALVPPASAATETDLVNAGVFAVALDDGGGDVWRVYIYRDGADDVAVKVRDPGDPVDVLRPACSAAAGTNGHVIVDISNATVGGQPCPDLDIVGELVNTFDIEFERGASAAGTYKLIVDRDYDFVNDPAEFGASGGPRVNYALYSVTVELTYVTPELRYETTVTVVPGETQ